MKNTIISALMVLILVSGANASQKSGCELAQVGAVEVSWTGYKTEKKVGVGGVFDSVTYTPVAKSGENFRSILVGSSVVIDTSSVNSKNEGRDEKLAKFFFSMMSDKNIKAKIVDIKADKRVKNAPRTGVVDVEIEMNGVKKVVPMKYSFSDSIFEAKGSIDILDFSAGDALSSINKACFDLHEGKTWSEAGIAFKTKIEAILCNVEPLKE
ncbi:YceI family protein [Sulfurimonas sp.]|uniref:YceI family protein n=1 Tax=Sulfurimonas sp. TaxID=2022749 RepID=UPI0019F76DE8|nr:YceI family protein [Sulfurimonas sp.]MBE0513848.1 YceI family protein [Sulfurimonas sp.]